MSFPGTIVNGSIVLDGAPRLPEGSRVEVDVVEEDFDTVLAGMPIPFTMETHEEFLQSLRQEVADIKAGIRGIPLEQLERELCAEFNLPPIPKE